MKLLTINPAALLLLALSSAVARGEAPPNTLPEAERRGGWQLIFDGNTLDRNIYRFEAAV